MLGEKGVLRSKISKIHEITFEGIHYLLCKALKSENQLIITGNDTINNNNNCNNNDSNNCNNNSSSIDNINNNNKYNNNNNKF